MTLPAQNKLILENQEILMRVMATSKVSPINENILITQADKIKEIVD